jgi:hypothetical protein
VNDDVKFFYEHAGYSFNPATETEEEGRMAGARALAEAEGRVKAGPYFFTEEPDDQPWDGDFPYDGPLWHVALLSVEGATGATCVAGIGGVACELDSDYMRVVRAELALEHLSTETGE